LVATTIHLTIDDIAIRIDNGSVLYNYSSKIALDSDDNEGLVIEVVDYVADLLELLVYKVLIELSDFKKERWLLRGLVDGDKERRLVILSDGRV